MIVLAAIPQFNAILLFVFILHSSIYINNCHDQVTFDCASARTCSDCISIAKECKWCTKEPFTSSGPRCNSQFFPSDCPASAQINPQVQNIKTVQNRPFSDSIDDPVQLRPQLIEVEARVGAFATVGIDYKQAEDYPMDLYYLMDLSYTMLKHKNSVSRMGKKLADKITTTTKDFRIGFGSFVDKETTPFANYERKTVTYQKTLIEYSHSFINHMSLSKSTSQFEQQVINSQISGNLDSPEGTLDALMQVMVCDREIGWRPQSDKIIVVASDEEFHYGGDGKIGGILIPNDGKCHVENGRYTGSTIYDYPTMHHIAEVAQKKKFNIVFSVSSPVVRDYRVLSEIIGSNSRVAHLTENDDSIADLIEEVYRNISTSVELVVEHKPDNVDIEIWTNCANAKQRFTRTSICGFQGKISIPFQIRIKLISCTIPGSYHDSVVRIGLLNKNETVEIQLKELCKCDCETKGVANSPKCSNNGTFSCGICTTCNGIRSGKMCECDPDKPIDPRAPDAHCRKSGDSRPCSGHGQCICAKCMCDPEWAGDYCEEDQSGCYDKRGIKCNNQGECVNNQCQCNQLFTGKFCDCIRANETCISNHTTGEICSNRGECRCGRCECKQATAHGRFCQKCPLCDAPVYCEQILSCVPKFSKKFCVKPKPEKLVTDKSYESINLASSLSGTSNQSLSTNQTNPCTIDPEECVSILANWNHQMIDEVFEVKKRKQPDEKAKEEDNSANSQMKSLNEQSYFNYQCLKVINGCDVSYAFRLIYETDRPQVETIELSPIDDPSLDDEHSKRPKETLHFKITPFQEICPQPVNMVVVGSSAFFSVMLFGLLTICVWKILTEYWDRKDYERFMMEVDAANFTQSENPLYKDVKVQFRNPVFGLRDRTSRFFFNKK